MSHLDSISSHRMERLLGRRLRYGCRQTCAGYWLGTGGLRLRRKWPKLHELTSGPARSTPIPTLIADLNRHLKGWGNYFRFDYPRRAFDKVNEHVQVCLRQNLGRRSQRPFRPPEGITDYANFQRLGLKLL